MQFRLPGGSIQCINLPSLIVRPVEKVIDGVTILSTGDWTKKDEGYLISLFVLLKK
jgi:hypothetical protein